MSSIKLYAMTCGWLSAPYSLFLQGEPGEVFVPVPSYLIVHPKGTVLFDSGLEKSWQGLKSREAQLEVLGAFADTVAIQFVPGQDVAERLKSYDYDPAKINYLVNSHLHYDHCGGNALIPNARLVVQQREWEAAFRPEGIESNGYKPHQYDLGHDRLEVSGEHDLFGDGSVVLIPTYGHTPGHQSIQLNLDGKTVVITSDACYMKASLERMILPDPVVVRDAQAMLNNFKMFSRLRENGAFIIYGHDPDQAATLTSGELRQITAADLKNSWC